MSLASRLQELELDEFKRFKRVVIENRNLFNPGFERLFMGSLEELREGWLSLIRKNQIESANSFYWGNLFPLVEKKFLDNTNNVECDWLILPCGLETSYYVLLIKSLKPKKVYFLGTQKFIDDFLGLIIERAGLKVSQYLVDSIDYNEMNITEVYERVRSKMEFFLGKKVYVDLTRGKRVMSVSAGIVASFFGFELVYIDEDWVDDVKRGLPGTEKLVIVKNPFEVFGDLEIKEARDFFDNYNYPAALKIYQRVKQKIVDPRQLEFEMLLSEAYSYWNSFNFKAALTKLEICEQKRKQYNLKTLGELESNLNALRILCSNEQEQFDKFNLHLIFDLYTNGLRKAEIGAFEDGVSRLYRTLEMISQYRLKSYGIESSKPNIEKYSSEYKALTKKIYGFEKALPSEVGLKDGYLLLFILKDYVVEGYSLEWLTNVFGIIRARDDSIVAHGSKLAGDKSFANMRDLAKELIQKICAKQNVSFSDLIKQHSFIQL